MTTKTDQTKLTLTDFLRKMFKNVLNPIATFLNRLGLKPNTLTIIGLIGNAIGAYIIATGRITLGGIIILIMGPIDALDGTMARLRGESTRFGAFVDSVTDRYSELIILGGLLYYFSLVNESPIGVILTYLAAIGSVLVSYIRARAQSLKVDTKIGVLTRVERYIVLAPLLIFNLPIYAVAIIGAFANITALQRIFDVRKKFIIKQSQDEDPDEINS